MLKHMDVEQQRCVVVGYLLKFVEGSLRKYDFEGLDVSAFMLALKKGLVSIGWLG